MTKAVPAFLLSLFLSASLPAADAPDLAMQTRIRQEGFRNSKVMELAQGLTDVRKRGRRRPPACCAARS